MPRQLRTYSRFIACDVNSSLIRTAGYVAEYLSNVPQARKFVSDSTGDLIANSVKWKPVSSIYDSNTDETVQRV